MHIGLIGGIGPAATEYYYRSLVNSHAAQSSLLELTIAHADLDRLMQNMSLDDKEAQAEVFCRHATQLAAAGAEIAAVTSIAGHFCFKELEKISPLPLLNALETLRQEVGSRKLTRIGLLGSKIAIESKLYGSLDAVEIVLPDENDIDLVSDAYFSMARAQRATATQRDLFFDVGERLCSEQSAEAVILAGTDMFLAFADTSPSFDVIDCADVHIKALTAL